MKIRIEYFSWWPQIAAIILGIFVSEIAHDAETTYLGYSAIVLIVIINAMAVSYCSYCMDKGLSIQKISYYERTAFLWETVAEELRKEGKYPCADTLLESLIEATKKWDKE